MTKGHVDLHLEVLDDYFVRCVAPAADLDLVLDRTSGTELIALMAAARLDLAIDDALFVVTTSDHGAVTASAPAPIDATSWGWDVLDTDEREVWLVKHDEERRAAHCPEPHEVTQLRIGVEGGRSLFAVPSLDRWVVGTSAELLPEIIAIRQSLQAEGSFLGEAFGPLLLSRTKLEAIVGRTDVVSHVHGEFQFDVCAAHRLAGALVSSLMLRHPQLSPTLVPHELAG